MGDWIEGFMEAFLRLNVKRFVFHSLMDAAQQKAVNSKHTRLIKKRMRLIVINTNKLKGDIALNLLIPVTSPRWKPFLWPP